jgi:hypothetical protein
MSYWSISSNTGVVSFVGGLPSGVDNDQGSIRYGGNVKNTDRFGKTTFAEESRFITIVSGVNGVDSVFQDGVFNGGDQVIKRVTDEVAGLPSLLMISGSTNSANASKSINQVTTVNTYMYKTAIRANKWNEYTGAWDSGYPEVRETGVYDLTLDRDVASGVQIDYTDVAANPSGEVPGVLLYRDGKPLPVVDQYKKKTLF